MKKLLLMCVLVMTMTMLLSNTKNIQFANTKDGISLVNNKSDKIVLDMNVGELMVSDVKTKGGNFTEVFIPGFIGTGKPGLPQLPYISKIIAIPVNADISVNYVNTKISQVDLNQYGFNTKIVPAQPSIAKNVDLSTVSFVKNEEAYGKSSYESHIPVRVEEIGYMRGYRLAQVIYTPVEYNPIKNEMKVYDHIKVEVTFENADIARTEEMKTSHYSPMFETVLNQNILNYTSPNIRDALTRFPVKYVIISDPMFQAQLQPFIEWKKMQGFQVIEKYKGDPEVGSTKESIKAYLQGLWNSATTENPAPTYLLIVGDHGQIPGWTGTTETDHKTDLNYVRLQGIDYLPEMYYGRFSANTTSELQPQIDKTLYYEKYQIADPTYLGKSVLIAGVDQTYGPKHANAQINYASTQYVNPAHGTTPFIHLYPASQNAVSAILNEFNQGVGFGNYTAHGDWDGWYDPAFSNTNVSNMQNANKYSFMIGNCCLTNKFDVTTCFGEALLRAANKGAIGYIGGTNVSYWDEDYWWGVGFTGSAPQNGNAVPYNANQLGMYDKLFHTHNEVYDNWYTSQGQIVYSGNLAVQQSSSSLKDYYWEIYSLMGDPSLVPYMRIPDSNPANYLTTLFIGMDIYSITGSTPHSFVSLSMNGVILGTGLTDENGALDLEITPITTPGTAKLVISAQNNIPIISDIQVITNQGAYIVFENCTLGLSGNTELDYNSNTPLSVSVRNIGNVDAQSLTAVIRSLTPFVVVTDSTANVSTISANGNYNFSNGFQITSLSNSPDNTMADLQLIVTDTQNHSWTSAFSLHLNAPNIQAGTITIDDSNGNNNGHLDPGETVSLIIPVQNTGHALSQNGNLSIESLNPLVTLSTHSIQVNSIEAGQSANYIVNVTADAGTAVGTVVNLGYFIDLNSQVYQGSYALSVGLIIESFETGNFTANPWILGTPSWTIINTNAFDGTYCAKSGTISDNGVTTLSIINEASSAGVIKFAYKVSSEPSYDFLQFYIDNDLIDSWSGSLAWSETEFNVAAGNHTYKWQYKKDIRLSNGSDCAWIDKIIFPSGGSAQTGAFAGLNTQALSFGYVSLGETLTKEFTIINYGSSTLNCTLSSLLGYTYPNGNVVNVAPNSHTFVKVKFSPTSETQYNGNIVITTNDTQNPSLNLVVNGTASGNEDNPLIPKLTKLNSNYPNPFNPETIISFDLKDNSPVKLSVYNIKGQLVNTLIEAPYRAGYHKISWNGKDNNHQKVSSGIYFYRLETKNYQSTRKMILMK